MAYKAVALPMDLLDTLDQYMYAGMDRTREYEITPGFAVMFRTLTGEEEVECRTTAAEFRGPAYIYTYKTKVLAYTICSINGVKLEPGAVVKVPREREDEHGRIEEVLTDVPLNIHLETRILTWSKALIDVCFKLWSKHQEDQLYRYISPLNQDDLFSVEEKSLAKEYERLLNENNAAVKELTPAEVVVAASTMTPASDLVKIGSQVTKQAEPHLDMTDSDVK